MRTLEAGNTVTAGLKWLTIEWFSRECRIYQIDISFLCAGVSSAGLLACGSWFHSHFDNVMMQFFIIKRTDALKTDVNLFFYNNKTAKWSIAGNNFGETTP